MVGWVFNSAYALETFIHQNELRHITPLKVSELFGSRLHSAPLRVADEAAYLLWSMRGASQYDSAKYPTMDVVFHPTVNVSPSAAMLEPCTGAILDTARGRVFVTKTIEPKFVVVLRALALTAHFSYERALCTLDESA